MHLSQAVTYTETTCRPGRSYYAKGGIIKMCSTRNGARGSASTRQAEADNLARDAKLAELKAKTAAFTLVKPTYQTLPMTTKITAQSAPLHTQSFAPSAYITGDVVRNEPEPEAVKEDKGTTGRLVKVAGLVAGGFLLLKGIL